MTNPISPIMGIVSHALTAAIKPIIPTDPMPSIPNKGINIDMSKDVIVLWVPGTSEHEVNESFAFYTKKYWGDQAALSLVDYEASWRMKTSYADGVERLRAFLDHIRARIRPGQRVVIAGESQGAMVIGEVMADPKYSKLISRAVLLGHPGVSPHHYKGKNVLELNNPLDPTTFPWKVGHTEILTALEKLSTEDSSAIPMLLKVIAKNPVFSLWLLILQAQRVPALSESILNTHDYRGEMEHAVLWLRQILK